MSRLTLLAMAHPGVSRADAPTDEDKRPDEQDEYNKRNRIPPMKAQHTGHPFLSWVVALFQPLPFAGVALPDAPSNKSKPAREQDQYENYRNQIPQVDTDHHCTLLRRRDTEYPS